MKIKLSTNERVIFVGRTGSGKTELAKHFLKRLSRVIVIDPKHTFRLDGFKVRRSLPLFGSEFRIIYRPRLEDDDELGDLIYRLNRQRGLTVYCDELATMAEQYPQSTAYLADLARTGRERNLSVWTALQRPRWVPRVFFTEAEVMFIFDLRAFEDRAYMAQFSDPIVTERIEQYTFWYSHAADGGEPPLMRLNLGKNYIEKIG